MGQLKAILFDIDDTLFSTTAFAAKARENAVQAMVDAGLDLPREVVLGELKEVIAEFSSNYDRHFDKLLQRLRPPSLADCNPALIIAAGVAAYHDTKFKELAPFEDVYPLFEDLRRIGIRLGIVTHGWTTKQAEKLVRLKLVPYLDPGAIFISDQIGISKPNPKLYVTVLEDLGLKAREVMYIGDNPTDDIAPPKSLGMITVWARRAAKKPLGDIEPDHVVGDFDELRSILVDQYALPL